MRGTILSILQWHAATRPQPTQQDASTQLGVHFEEVTEMADALLLIPGITEEFEGELINFINMGRVLGTRLKTNQSGIDFFSIEEDIRWDILDSYMDQLVTVLGAAYTQNYDVLGAAEEVDASNWSKFDEKGNPIFNENKKVIKGPHYRKAALDEFVLNMVMSVPQEQQNNASMENAMTNLSQDASYDDLRAEQDRITALIEAKRADARLNALTSIVTLVNEFEISDTEIAKALSGKGKPGRKAGSKVSTDRSVGEPKYANPADLTQTWTGRGASPAWIKDVPKDQRAAYLITSVVELVEAIEVAETTAEEAEAVAPTTAPVFGNFAE